MPYELEAVGSTLFYGAIRIGASTQLWKSDGTPAGTKRLVQVPGSHNGLASMPMAAGRNVFFVYDNGATGLELWRSDLTQEGTRLVRDINMNR